MNKQEIENKLKEFCSKEIKENYNLRLDIDNLKSIATKAYNFALELAAENAITEKPEKQTESMGWNNVSPRDYHFFSIDKQSILDLKL